MATSLLRLAPRSTPSSSYHPRSHAPSRAPRGGVATSASRVSLRRSLPAACLALLLLLLLTTPLLRSRSRARSRPLSPEGLSTQAHPSAAIRVASGDTPGGTGGDGREGGGEEREAGGECAHASGGSCGRGDVGGKTWQPLRVYLLLLPSLYNVDLIPMAQSLLPPAALSSPSPPSPSAACAVPIHSPHAVPLSWLQPPSSRSSPSASSASSLTPAASPDSTAGSAGSTGTGTGSGSAPGTLPPHLLPLLGTPDLPDVHMPVSLSAAPSPPPPASLPASAAPVDVSVPCYPEYPYYRQHGAEYFLTLSLLTGSATVQRVQSPEEAEVVFVPYFSTLAFRTNASEVLDPIIARVAHRHAATAASTTATAQATNGTTDDPPSTDGTDTAASSSGAGSRDSTGSGSPPARVPPLVVPVVYPLAMFNHTQPLSTAIKLAVDLDLHWTEAASFDRDVVVPYVPLVLPFTHDTGSWAARPLLLFFQGTTDRWGGGIIRQHLQHVLQGEEGVQFTVSRADNSSMTGEAGAAMRRAKYCLVPRGDTSSSCRLFDAVLSGCIPVVISDALDPPFEDAIDYTAFSILIPAALAVRPGYILGVLHGRTEAAWRQQWEALREVRPGGSPLPLLLARTKRRCGGHGVAGSGTAGEGGVLPALPEQEGAHSTWAAG
ncbi:hypothetical protein CLOM_g22752 [Closterium sp. NIES-68]|nr:hypothetical protein CLOM_g22752 [Closterium sp. NIES-68]GJP60567.1 hypothetical protein CLOP_g17807 [Closterium sp. NIES-67]